MRTTETPVTIIAYNHQNITERWAFLTGQFTLLDFEYCLAQQRV